jgi:Flp pilus assembly protein TadD
LNKFPIVILALVCAAAAQSTRPAAKARPRMATSTAPPKLPPELEKAEAAIAQKDFAGAELLLVQETRANPQDFRAWYDLGFVYYQTQRAEQAIKAYRQSIALRGDLAETHAALGHVLLELDRNEEAIPHLRRVAELKPTAEAWMMLGAAQENSHAEDALQSYAKAADFAPHDPEPRARIGGIYEARKDWASAEREYRTAQAIQSSPRALAGLVNIYRQTKRTAELELALREYLKLQPDDANAHFQLGELLLTQGKNDEAWTEISTSRSGRHDEATLRGIASMLVSAKDYAHAIEIYRELVAQDPNRARFHAELGDALIHAKQLVDAEKELITAGNLNAKDPEILGSLAIAASQNNHFELALKALDARAKVAPDTPPTYFLRATSYDHLRQYKLAAENYRLFLAAANGAYPDEEWKARHRLIAIEPDGGKKKK